MLRKFNADFAAWSAFSLPVIPMWLGWYLAQCTGGTEWHCGWAAVGLFSRHLLSRLGSFFSSSRSTRLCSCSSQLVTSHLQIIQISRCLIVAVNVIIFTPCCVSSLDGHFHFITDYTEPWGSYCCQHEMGSVVRLVCERLAVRHLPSLVCRCIIHWDLMRDGVCCCWWYRCWLAARDAQDVSEMTPVCLSWRVSLSRHCHLYVVIHTSFSRWPIRRCRRRRRHGCCKQFSQSLHDEQKGIHWTMCHVNGHWCIANGVDHCTQSHFRAVACC